MEDHTADRTSRKDQGKEKKIWCQRPARGWPLQQVNATALYIPSQFLDLAVAARWPLQPGGLRHVALAASGRRIAIHAFTVRAFAACVTASAELADGMHASCALPLDLQTLQRASTPLISFGCFLSTHVGEGDVGTALKHGNLGSFREAPQPRGAGRSAGHTTDDHHLLGLACRNHRSHAKKGGSRPCADPEEMPCSAA
jgi:hypothetical protein